MKLPSSSFDEN
jgi:hypothetical protein